LFDSWEGFKLLGVVVAFLEHARLAFVVHSTDT
jgi:hypothetical protein